MLISGVDRGSCDGESSKESAALSSISFSASATSSSSRYSSSPRPERIIFMTSIGSTCVERSFTASGEARIPILARLAMRSFIHLEHHESC